MLCICAAVQGSLTMHCYHTPSILMPFKSRCFLSKCSAQLPRFYDSVLCIVPLPSTTPASVMSPPPSMAARWADVVDSESDEEDITPKSMRYELFTTFSSILPQESVHALEVLSQKTPSIFMYRQPRQEYTWVQFAPFLENSFRRILVNPDHHPAELAAQLGLSDVILLHLDDFIKPLPLTVSFGEHVKEIVSFWVADRDEAQETAELTCVGEASSSWPVLFPQFPGPSSLTAKNLRHLVHHWELA